MTSSAFEDLLAVAKEELDLILREGIYVPWADFILNPRRLRGSDFLMRWSQGVWSEDRLVHAVEDTGRYFALPYGPSGTAPDDDVREFELYFERLEKAGLGKVKRPDLLIFRKADEQKVQALVTDIGGVKELPFTPESDERMRTIIAKAIIAVECENSLWQARKMPGYRSELSPQKRLGGKPGLKKSVVVPTVIIKDEDRIPLREWQKTHLTKLHIWHVFYDLAFGLSLDESERLIKEGLIEPTRQVFQAPGGATTAKIIYKFYYHYAYPIGESIEEPKLVADFIADKNGHILPYVRFEGGRLALGKEAQEVLERTSAVIKDDA